MGMTYGNPSIARALEQLRAAGAARLVVLPLYPQYSATTTAAALDRVDAALARWPAPPGAARDRGLPRRAGPRRGARRRASRAARAPCDHLLFSFHGIPQRYADRRRSLRRSHATRRRDSSPSGSGSRPERWSVAFQSRVGGARWLEPYTEERLRALARAGVRALAVVCPGFAVDCLETLEEIAIRGARDLPRRRRRPLPTTFPRSTTTRRRWTASRGSSRRAPRRGASAR